MDGGGYLVRVEGPHILSVLVLPLIVLELASDAANHGYCPPSLHLLSHQVCDSLTCPTPSALDYSTVLTDE